MNSCLYDCELLHDRRAPKRHRFNYRAPMFAIDLDEVERLDDTLWLFSRNRRNVFALNDRDHLREGLKSIKDNLRRYLSALGIRETLGKVTLLTNLRTFGYIFNPVSFYFVEDASGKPLTAVAEVANTFNEMKLYPVRSLTRNGLVFRERHIKNFYISPYSPLDTEMTFRLGIPGDTLSLAVTESREGSLYFASALKGKRKELTNRNLAAFCFRFPFSTAVIMARIHFQALKLYLKKIPFYRKAENPDRQTETRVYLESDAKKTPTH